MLDRAPSPAERHDLKLSVLWIAADLGSNVCPRPVARGTCAPGLAFLACCLGMLFCGTRNEIACSLFHGFRDPCSGPFSAGLGHSTFIAL